MKTYLLTLLGLSMSIMLSAQEMENNLILRQDNKLIYCQTTTKQVKTQSDVFYYWTKKRKMHRTEGAYGGHLLDGGFEAYFPSGQLYEKGEMKKGAKQGEWIRWFESGTKREVIHYKRGVSHGVFIRYNEEGVVTESGSYKKGIKHGKWYASGVEGENMQRYKHGEPIPNKSIDNEIPDPEHTSEVEDSKKEKVSLKQRLRRVFRGIENTHPDAE